MREIFGQFSLEKKAFVFFAGALIMSVIGPFGTYDTLSFWLRLSYWFVIMFGVGFFMHFGVLLALRTPYLGPLGQLARIALGSVLSALPAVSVVVFVELVFRPPMISPETIPRLWVQVSIIGFFISVIEFFEWRERKPSGQVATDGVPQRSALHERLDAGTGTDIVSMSMQDHYVEVTTTRGRQLVLLRMQDAVREVAPVEGCRIHRSHWVALAHARDLSKRGPKAQVSLSDGRRLPVSATYFDALDQAMKTRASVSRWARPPE